MQNGSFGVCSGCGRQIIWIKTAAGKNMPVDTALKNFRADGGKDKIVLANGKVVSGTIVSSPEGADGSGYTSHFATCSNAGRFHRR